MKRIVVLGGGYGGVLTAKRLAKQFKKQSDVSIILIDKKPYHTLLTELHEVAAARVDEDSIKVYFHQIFAGRNVQIVLDEINYIDFNNKTLHSSQNTYEYAYLVLGSGSRPTFLGVEGAQEHAFSLWSHEDAVKLKHHIRNQFCLACQESDEHIRERMLSFVVVGGGFTGVEMMGELAEYKEELCKEFCIQSSEVALRMVDTGKRMLGLLPEKLSAKVKKRMEKLGVQIIPSNSIVKVTGSNVQLRTGETIETSTVIWTTGVEGSKLVEGLSITQKGRKRVETNEFLQSIDNPFVYVVGDNIFYIPKGSENPVPQMVENAEHAAELVAHNIAAELSGKTKHSYNPGFHGMMVCVGGRYGVAHIGTPNWKISLSGFLAVFFKHAVNMLYLFKICGWNKLYAYMLHEFFHVRNKRSLVGGHFSKRSPSLWLVPLRLYTGYIYIKHGLEVSSASEILIGGMFLTGFFTFLAVLSTFFIASSFYEIVVGIALLSGTGTTLGLDYYVFPFLKSRWNQISWVKRLYLYID